MILLILSVAACILWFLVKFVTILFFAADCIVVMMLSYNFAAQNILPLVGNGTSGDVPIALACAVVGAIALRRNGKSLLLLLHARLLE